jgi:truncated hemoglobin YjbI
MAEDRTLTRLVSELTLEERKNLLEKLKSQSSLSAEPLYEVKEDAAEFKIEDQYAKLPWYYRLIYFVLSFFKSKSPIKIFEDSQVARVGREIEGYSPGLYDYQHSYLLSEFYQSLQELKEAARFFFTALDASVGRDKGVFYAFLGSLELEETHRQLQGRTDPNDIMEKSPGASEAELRQMAFRAMEDAFAAITGEQRDAMYYNARSLHCLRELSSFLFDRILMAFGFEPAASGQVCSVNVVREMLQSLNNILFSLQAPPPLPLLESLFVFLLQERVGNSGFDINQEMRNLLSRSENALATIRTFNSRVPLTLILRCANRDMSLSPQPVSGGEDWFLVYREHWKRHIELQFAEFSRLRRHQDLLNSFRYFLKGANLKILDNVVSETNPNGLPIPEALGLSFLLTFYSAVFMNDINKTLRPILIDGEFFKRENRTEFTEAYNELIKLEDEIRKFELNISPAGDYGKRYSLAKQDMSSLPVKRRKIQLVLQDASGEAKKIIDSARSAVKSMMNILNGILGKDPVGKYDILGNMSQFSGRGPAFVNSINDAIQKFQKTLQLLDDIDVMEGGRN